MKGLYRFVTACSLVMVPVVSCQEVMPSDQEEQEAVVKFIAGAACYQEPEADTRSSMSVDEYSVTDINIYAYCNGRLETSGYYSGTSQFSLKLTQGKTYDLFAIANAGRHEAPKYQSELYGMRLYFRDPGSISASLPMAWESQSFAARSGMETRIDLVRLVARLNLRIDQSLIKRMNVTSVRMCQSALDVVPFVRKDGIVCGSRAESIGNGDYASEADLAVLSNGGSVHFYALENCNGTPAELAGNTDPWNKVPSKATGISYRATYLEVKCTLPEGHPEGGSVTYRMYLGKDVVKNFDIERNADQNLTLILTEDGTGELSWKVADDRNCIRFRNREVMIPRYDRALVSVAVDSDDPWLLLNKELTVEDNELGRMLELTYGLDGKDAVRFNYGKNGGQYYDRPLQTRVFLRTKDGSDHRDTCFLTTMPVDFRTSWSNGTEGMVQCGESVSVAMYDANMADSGHGICRNLVVAVEGASVPEYADPLYTFSSLDHEPATHLEYNDGWQSSLSGGCRIAGFHGISDDDELGTNGGLMHIHAMEEGSTWMDVFMYYESTDEYVPLGRIPVQTSEAMQWRWRDDGKMLVGQSGYIQISKGGVPWEVGRIVVSDPSVASAYCVDQTSSYASIRVCGLAPGGASVKVFDSSGNEKLDAAVTVDPVYLTSETVVHDVAGTPVVTYFNYKDGNGSIVPYSDFDEDLFESRLQPVPHLDIVAGTFFSAEAGTPDSRGIPLTTYVKKLNDSVFGNVFQASVYGMTLVPPFAVSAPSPDGYSSGNILMVREPFPQAAGKVEEYEIGFYTPEGMGKDFHAETDMGFRFAAGTQTQVETAYSIGGICPLSVSGDRLVLNIPQSAAVAGNTDAMSGVKYFRIKVKNRISGEWMTSPQYSVTLWLAGGVMAYMKNGYELALWFIPGGTSGTYANPFGAFPYKLMINPHLPQDILGMDSQEYGTIYPDIVLSGNQIGRPVNEKLYYEYYYPEMHYACENGQRIPAWYFSMVYTDRTRKVFELYPGSNPAYGTGEKAFYRVYDYTATEMPDGFWL